jgi:putative lipoic acid-binding regulatory protein
MASTNRSPLEFPCSFPLKAIGTGVEDFEALVVAIIRKHVPGLAGNAVSSRVSSGGTYLAVTATFIAESKEQLDALYFELSSHARVKWVL